MCQELKMPCEYMFQVRMKLNKLDKVLKACLMSPIIRTKLASPYYLNSTIIKLYFVSFVQFFCVCLDDKFSKRVYILSISMKYGCWVNN